MPVTSIFAAYVAALFYARDLAPYGLNNDAAEEALRGLYLIAQGRFEAVTLILGNSAETLYLYLEGAASLLFGPSTLTIQAISWIFALSCLALTARVTQRMAAGTPAWLPLMVGGSSLWLFHFARSGLRTIAAPFFLMAFALALDCVERDRKQAARALLCGGILGLGLYGYTSSRAIVIAFVGYALYRLWREKDDPRQAIRCYGLILVGILAVSIPNLAELIETPDDVLLRGAYVAPAHFSDAAANIGWSAIFPLYYPAEYQVIWGPHFQSDGVSLGFLAAGFRPISIALALLAVFGWWRSRYSPMAVLLAAAWVAVTVTVGLGGPSPTRLLVLFPVFVVFASSGLAALLRGRPKRSLAVYACLTLLAVFHFGQYMGRAGPLSRGYGGNATMIGKAARKTAATGKNVICVVQADANVVRYLTYGYEKHVTVVEFYRRPPVENELPPPQKDGVLIVENASKYRELITSLRSRGAEVEVAGGPI